MKELSKGVRSETQKLDKTTLEVAERLQGLFEFVQANDLREYLIKFYHSYILHEHNSLPSDFKDMTESLLIFLDFLKFVDEEFKEQASSENLEKQLSKMAALKRFLEIQPGT